MSSIEVTTLDLAALQVLGAQLKGQLSKFGYSTEFLNAIAIAEEWLEPRHWEFCRLINNATDYSYKADERKARKLLLWGEEEEDAIYCIFMYLEVKGNPKEALKIQGWGNPK